MSELKLFWPYVLAATGVGLLGGLVALIWRPRVRARSAIQHFAAGAVLAAVASNVIPEVQHIGTTAGVLGGLTAGGLAMVGLKWLVVRLERGKTGKAQVPVGLAAAAGVDTLLDGAIIAAGFSTGQQLGTLLAVALSVELFFLTLSVGSEFREAKGPPWQGLAVTSGIAGLLLVGAVAANVLLRGAADATIAIVLAFGAAALIYLIAEELLVETIQAEDSLFSTATLFAGFVALIALELYSGKGTK